MKNNYKLWTGVLGGILVLQSSYKVLSCTEGSMFWACMILAAVAISIPISMIADYTLDSRGTITDRTLEYHHLCEASKNAITVFMSSAKEIDVPQGEIFCLYYDNEFGSEEGKVDVIGLYCTDTSQVYIKGSKDENIHLNLIEKSDIIYLESVLSNL